MKKTYILIFLTGVIFAQNSERDRENDIPYHNDNKAFVHLVSNIGYTNYGIDITSTEFDRAIDYTLLELTVGAEYHYNYWGYGLFYKSRILEIDSNSIVTDTGGKDKATIDRGEFIASISYLLKNVEYDYEDEWFFNLAYYKSSLKSDDSFKIFNTYESSFTYDTEGVALSTSFIQKPWGNKHTLTFTGGVLYTKADLSIYATKNSIPRDTYVKDSVNAYGIKVGVGYKYDITPNFSFKASGDWYYLNFQDVDIFSIKNGGLLEKGTLNESTYSIRLGGAYIFDL